MRMAKTIKNLYIPEYLLLISKQSLEKPVIYIPASDIARTLTPK